MFEMCDNGLVKSLFPGKEPMFLIITTCCRKVGPEIQEAGIGALITPDDPPEPGGKLEMAGLPPIHRNAGSELEIISQIIA